MEIEIPNHTSNGYYNVKKYAVICSGKFGSKSGELQLGKINGQEKEIKVKLQVPEWERMKENYFSPDNAAANLGQVVLSDKLELMSEEWISPEQNKYHLIKFVQTGLEGASVKQSYPYSLTTSEYHNLMKLFPVIDVTLGVYRLEKIDQKYTEIDFNSPGNFASRNNTGFGVGNSSKQFSDFGNKEDHVDWEQFRKDVGKI